jgi:formylglycine-generating enzyme required for sulfatase activity
MPKPFRVPRTAIDDRFSNYLYSLAPLPDSPAIRSCREATCRAGRNRAVTTVRVLRFRARSVVAWLDRLPLPVVVAAGVTLGCGIGGAGFLHLEAPGWALFWLALFAGLGWLGNTAKPVFFEPNPVQATTRPRRILDGSLPMVDLPGGRFVMGSPDSDDMAEADEKPEHEVTVAPFRMAITPVTVELYEKIMAPSTAAGERAARLPATGVSWVDAVRFCNRLSNLPAIGPATRGSFGRWRCNWRADGYRLPTEAEWEYACRAGSTSRYGFGDDPAGLDGYAWYAGNANGQPQPVATRRANAWGLYDMHGNVWEWCWDWYGSYTPGHPRNPRGPMKFRSGRRVLRGGSFFFPPAFLRSAHRFVDVPEFWVRGSGFRCVRVPPQHLDRLTD